jgi:hypothetical protein
LTSVSHKLNLKDQTMVTRKVSTMSNDEDIDEEEEFELEEN